jgi:hypothetical protein
MDESAWNEHLLAKSIILVFSPWVGGYSLSLFVFKYFNFDLSS